MPDDLYCALRTISRTLSSTLVFRRTDDVKLIEPAALPGTDGAGVVASSLVVEVWPLLVLEMNRVYPLEAVAFIVTDASAPLEGKGVEASVDLATVDTPAVVPTDVDLPVLSPTLTEMGCPSLVFDTPLESVILALTDAPPTDEEDGVEAAVVVESPVVPASTLVALVPVDGDALKFLAPLTLAVAPPVFPA
ncbi:unnamed protein product [Phytophthora lilii]|uniref:Unnamed protein product n=1 Tax=Phytophthora lilii TaxID=2077276 RepID=A0A9W6XRP5_9STRA|nr:unnamed protein product [Phytophthora lilii]